MRHLVSLFCVLGAVWLGWSGHTEPLLLALGLLSCLVVLGIARRMRLLDAEGVPLRLGLRPLAYLPWLAWEVFKANLDVARRILTPSLPIRPRVIRVHPGQKSDLGRVLFANSITLTPGTLSLHVDQDKIVVHALTRKAADDLLHRPEGMNARVTRLEGTR